MNTKIQLTGKKICFVYVKSFFVWCPRDVKRFSDIFSFSMSYILWEIMNYWNISSSGGSPPVGKTWPLPCRMLPGIVKHFSILWICLRIKEFKGVSSNNGIPIKLNVSLNKCANYSRFRFVCWACGMEKNGRIISFFRLHEFLILIKSRVEPKWMPLMTTTIVDKSSTTIRPAFDNS